MEIRSGFSELSLMSQVLAVEGCPLSGVPLYYTTYVHVAIRFYCGKLTMFYAALSVNSNFGKLVKSFSP